MHSLEKTGEANDGHKFYCHKYVITGGRFEKMENEEKCNLLLDVMRFGDDKNCA